MLCNLSYSAVASKLSKIFVAFCLPPHPSSLREGKGKYLSHCSQIFLEVFTFLYLPQKRTNPLIINYLKELPAPFPKAERKDTYPTTNSQMFFKVYLWNFVKQAAFTKTIPFYEKKKNSCYRAGLFNSENNDDDHLKIWWSINYYTLHYIKN